MAPLAAEDALPRSDRIDLNVCTMALPRLLVGRCLTSFLDCLEDRDRYRLNWICLLDRDQLHREQSASRDCYAKTLDQIRDLVPLFDRSILVEPEYHRGYTDACSDVLTRAVYDILWIPHDWLWTKPFKLADVLSVTDDWFSFGPIGDYMGSRATSPTPPIFYRQHVVGYLRAHFPCHFHEPALAGVLKDKFDLTVLGITGEVCRRLGHKQ